MKFAGVGRKNNDWAVSVISPWMRSFAFVIQVAHSCGLHQMEWKTIVTGDDLNSEPKKLCLDQFLKLSWVVETGGHAKFLIQNGDVKVNGVFETRRRRKLVVGDVVEIGGKKLTVTDSLFG